MLNRLLSLCIISFIRLLLKTLRVTYIGDSINQTGVVAFLHGEQLPLLLNRPASLPLVSPISLSSDGELQVKIMRHFRVEAIRGSTSRGALSALRGLLRWLKQERGVALIAIDGPRGPYGHISPGAMYLARRLELPLWCCRVECTRAISLSTWDRFLIPLPFSSITIITHRCDPYQESVSNFLNCSTIEREKTSRQR